MAAARDVVGACVAASAISATPARAALARSEVPLGSDATARAPAPSRAGATHAAPATYASTSRAATHAGGTCSRRVIGGSAGCAAGGRAMPASLSPHGVAMCRTSRITVPAGKQAGSVAALGELNNSHASTHTAPASDHAPRQACTRVPVRGSSSSPGRRSAGNGSATRTDAPAGTPLRSGAEAKADRSPQRATASTLQCADRARGVSFSTSCWACEQATRGLPAELRPHQPDVELSVVAVGVVHDIKQHASQRRGGGARLHRGRG